MIENRDMVAWCISKGHLDFIKAIEKEGICTAIDDCIGIAARFGKLDIVKYYVEMKDVKIKSKDLCEACYKDNIDLVKYIFENLEGDNFGNVAESVIIAAEFGYLEITKFLLTKIILGKKSIDHIFFYCADRGHINIIKYFVENNMFPSDKSCIRSACNSDRFEVAKYLIDNLCFKEQNNGE